MKIKTSQRAEQKQLEEQARIAENKLRKKNIKEQKYIEKKMAQFANATPKTESA